MNLEIITGKSWAVNAQRLSAGEPVPFITGDTLRAQIRETPAGAVLVTVAAAVSVLAEGRFTLSLTDELTATLPVPRQFGIVRPVWLDVDIIRGTDVLAAIVNEKIYVKAGVTLVEEA